MKIQGRYHQIVSFQKKTDMLGSIPPMFQVLGLLCSLLTAAFSKLSEARDLRMSPEFRAECSRCSEKSPMEDMIRWEMSEMCYTIHSSSICLVIPLDELEAREKTQCGQVMYNAEEPQADPRDPKIFRAGQFNGDGHAPKWRMLWDHSHFTPWFTSQHI